MKQKFPLGKLTAQAFLKGYWQKKPLLIRKAFDPFPPLVTGDELAGLACESEVISRLILSKGGKYPWEMRKGPFSSKAFSRLPKSHWTLLVNGVDRFLPQVNALLDRFTFLPNWRIDDVMISYAVKKGGVGAHVDNYDVFLIQAEGKREWQIHTDPVWEEDYIPNRDVRQLKKFTPNQKWILEPGDMLYLPPRIPHNGIAASDGCMTFSIGFRAPGHAELIDAATSYAMSKVDQQSRYVDPDLKAQHPGELNKDALKRVRKILEAGKLNDEELAEWFGCYMSEAKDENVELPLEEPFSLSEVREFLKIGVPLLRSEGSRVAFFRSGKQKTLLFVNGCAYPLVGKSQAVAELLSEQVEVENEKLLLALKDKASGNLVLDFINSGAWYFQQ